ncbi:uncharacterized protein LOC135942108 [Cloeon dipterum]|uniref:uncharacterized protein LOC135942108 n=1 Tax=Cloeon dipterum TaxID=197152 RepID=UPI0032207100
MEKRDRNTMEKILIEGEDQGLPKGPSTLGFFQFESDGQIRTKNADNVFVLVVHYDFENTPEYRMWDKADVENLKKTFGDNRNCNFRSLYRPTRKILLDLLGSQEKLLRYFNSKVIPSVFVLFILSHGHRNGSIDTDYLGSVFDGNKYISFTTKEVFDSLEILDKFKECLKIVNFGPCRGELDDAKFDPNKEKYSYNNRNSCRITSFPDMPNTVIVYSTVETTTATTSVDGSWFVKIVCDVLNQMSEDKPLLLFLTSVQYAMHKVSLEGIDPETKLPVGQTAEVKMFPLDRSFSFSRSLTAEKSISRTDSRMEKAATITSTSEYFSWKSDEGKNIRGRRAFIFYEQLTKKVEETEKALRQNLDFDTRTWKLNDANLISYSEQVCEMEHDVGCVLTFIFGQVSEKKETKEVCVLVGGRDIPITSIVHEFVGPKNKRLIGKPKIFFIIDQKPLKCDSHSSAKYPLKVASTNHSGWLIMILKDKDLLEKLIEIFKGDELKKGRSLQELLVPLLTTGTKKELTLLNSTLQYLLDFPNWPRIFVKPDFKLTVRGNKKKICFKDLIKEAKMLRENQVWLLSSVAGAGKSTVLKEIAFQVGKSDQNAKILNISLNKNFKTLTKRRVDAVEFLAKTTGNSSEDINNWIAQKKVVVFLDGFDEICPHSRDKALGIVRALKEKRVPLCVATRPHEAKVIEETIKNATLVEIEPFDEAKQIEFLRLETNNNDEEIKRVLHAVQQIGLSNSIYIPLQYRHGNMNTILVNPLHLSLVAQCSGEGNLFQIYDKVVRKKVQKGLERKYGCKQVEDESIDKELIPLPLIAFRYMNNEPLVGDGVTREDLAKMNDYGVAIVEQETVTFLHQTFAEFLAAQHFLKNVGESSNFDFKFIGSWGMAEVSKFLDLFYSTLENEEEIKIYTQIKVPEEISNKSALFLYHVCEKNLKHIFKVLKPHITFCDVQMENYFNYLRFDIQVLGCKKHRSSICVNYAIKLLVKAIRSEEIFTELLEMNAIDSRTLEEYIDWVLIEIACYNATSVFNQLKETFPNFVELLRKSSSNAGAGCTAVANDNYEILELFLENGFGKDTLERSMYGDTLYSACREGKLKYVKILLKHGAKQYFDGRKIWDPLNVAVKHGQLDIVKLFVEEEISGLARDKVTLEANIFQTVKEYNGDFNAFHYAVYYGKKEIAEYLLSKSPHLKHIRTGEGKSPLQLAVDRRFGEFVLWLAREIGDDLSSFIPRGETQSWTEHDHFIYDHFLLLRGDLTEKDERGKSPLHCAAQHRHLQLVREFIAKDADVAAKDARGWNALHFACTFIDFINWHNNSEVVKLLHLTNPQLVKETTNEGETALHILVNNNFKRLSSNSYTWSGRKPFRFLVYEAGVDLEARDSKGRTAEDVANDKDRGYWGNLNREVPKRSHFVRISPLRRAASTRLARMKENYTFQGTLEAESVQFC